MEALWWALKTRDDFDLAWPLLAGGVFILVFSQSDFLLVVTRWFWRLAQPLPVTKVRPPLPPALVIIPSLLRNAADLEAITLTAGACALNGYPNELIIIASVDGLEDQPALLRPLLAWVGEHRHPKNVHLHVTGNPTRLGKMMAVEAGVQRMKELVDDGLHDVFPPLYFSIDGDGTLSPNALELAARRLLTPHRIGGNPRRVVSGKVCIRPDLFWKGWTLESLRRFFTVEGQIYWQVAREFVFSNVSRFNLKLKPQIGIPGALYCTWSQILLEAPRFMGFMKTIRPGQWLRWWLGAPPPSFSKSTAAPMPEALTGASDDTCISFLAAMSTWRGGQLVLEAPRTPLHALGRLVRSYFWDRSPDYEPEARVFTYTPSTLRSLWVQRVRWNASRFECGYRFKNAFAFHWEVGAWVLLHLAVTLSNILVIVGSYVLLPTLLFGGGHGVAGAVLAYALQTAVYGFFTLLALIIERDWRRFWPVLFAVPLAPLYSVCINFSACLTGLVKDLLLFGNTTKFAPEWTLAKGQTVRIALLFRVRRFLSLCVRAAVVGDVPFGAFWFGWTQTQWTPSGYDGWTTGQRRSIVPPVETWFRAHAVQRNLNGR